MNHRAKGSLAGRPVRAAIRPWHALAISGVAWTILCVGPGHAGLMHTIHPASLAVLAMWSVLVGRRLLHTVQAEIALRRISTPARINGIDCRVIAGDRGSAFALGSINPQIYIGEIALGRLEPAELSAVLLHEEHHRRTAAPLRAAAIDAWLTLTGWIPLAGEQLRTRLALLEASADLFAMDRGVSPQTIAMALIKTPPSPQPTSFATDAERRIRWLASVADGPARLERVLPWEWLPVATVAYMLATCLVVSLLRSL